MDSAVMPGHPLVGGIGMTEVAEFDSFYGVNESRITI